MRKIFAVTAILISSQLQAQDSSAIMDEVILSASKYSVKTTETGKVVTVINRQQIEKAGSRDLAQVITEFGGVFINGYNNNPGKEKNIYLRGARVDYTLITIDGIPVYDASGIGSNFDIRNISIDQVERIEILKGSQSTLYGSDAIAGVINIITRKGGTSPLSFSGTAHFGSYNSLRTNASFSGRYKKFDYQAGYARFRTDGFSEARRPEGSSPAFDRDGYVQNNFQLNLGFRPADAIHIQPFLRFGNFRGGLDEEAFRDATDFTNENRNLQTGIRSQLKLGPSQLNILYQYVRTIRDYLDDSAQHGSYYLYDHRTYEAAEHFAEAFVVIPLGQIKLTTGADFRKASTAFEAIQKTVFSPSVIRSMQGSDSVNQQQLAVYAALNFTKKIFSMEGGARFNHHSAYGSNFAFNLNPSLFFQKRIKVFANLSSGYKTPSLYQLFSLFGNKDLQPENSLNMEGGIQYFSGKGKASLRGLYFYRKITDAIGFFTDPSTWISRYQNQDEQRDHGFEIDGSLLAGEKVQLRAVYSWVDGKITTMQGGKDTTYFNLLRRPRSSFTFSAGSQLTKNFYAGIQLNAFGKRSDIYFDPVSFNAIPVELSEYVLINLSLEYSLLRGKLKCFADARNLLNEDYSDIYGYNTAGFNFYGGVRIHL